MSSTLSIQDVTPLAHRIKLAHRSKKCAAAIDEMLRNLEFPLERPYMPMCTERILCNLGMLPGGTATAIARIGRGKAMAEKHEQECNDQLAILKRCCFVRCCLKEKLRLRKVLRKQKGPCEEIFEDYWYWFKYFRDGICKQLLFVFPKSIIFPLSSFCLFFCLRYYRASFGVLLEIRECL